MKILHFDLETRPHLVYTWQTFKTTISHNQIVEPAAIMCFSYQWDHEDEVKFVSEYHDGRDAMLITLHDLLDEADIVIGYNNSGFDNKWAYSEFILEGMQPPSPFISVDLYQTIKRLTQFPSKRLAYVAPQLVDDTKITHSGFELWRGCMNNDPESWELMKTYAVKDTELLKPLYYRLKPFIKGHPNLALDGGPGFRCPSCASVNVQRRGYSYTGASRYQRFRCECGKWSRAKTRDSTTELRGL